MKFTAERYEDMAHLAFEAAKDQPLAVQEVYLAQAQAYATLALAAATRHADPTYPEELIK